MNSSYIESSISLLGETVCLCLSTTSMYVLETISRVGAIVELSLLAPHLRNPFSADRCLMKDNALSFVFPTLELLETEG